MMKVKTFHMIPVVAILTVMILGFQNCGGTRFSQVEDGLSLKGDGDGLISEGDIELPSDDTLTPPDAPEDVAQMTPPPSAPPPSGPPTPGGDRNPADLIENGEESEENMARKNCADFKNLAMPIAIPASAQDLKYENIRGHLEVAMAKNLEISNHASHSYVKAADSAVINNVRGQIRIAANNIPSLSNVAGNSCILAMKIGKLHNVAGKSAIIANEIEEISNHSGVIHIYGATVRKISNSNHNVCLYDGAVVLDASNVRGHIGRCK